MTPESGHIQKAIYGQWQKISYKFKFTKEMYLKINYKQDYIAFI